LQYGEGWREKREFYIVSKGVRAHTKNRRLKKQLMWEYKEFTLYRLRPGCWGNV